MKNQIGRRKFLVYSSASLSTSFLLKGCGEKKLSTTPAKIPNSPAKIIRSGKTIKIGFLYSLTGSTAIIETVMLEAQQLAIEEINASGGILGKKIEIIVEDGSLDNKTFADKATKLIDKDQVVAVFGCATSSSRKAVIPIFESRNHLLWSPTSYETQECSQNIFYSGAAANQQIEPALDWLLENKGKKFFLMGSDYIYPRTVISIIKEQLKTKGGEIAGEYYLPVGHTEVTPIILKINSVLPDEGIIFNALVGDSNVPFFKELQSARLEPDKYPVMSVGISEEEVRQIGQDYVVNQYAIGNYFQTLETPANQKFVKAFKRKYGQNRVTSTRMEIAYTTIYLWKQAVEKAGTPDDLSKVRSAAIEAEFNAPEGKIKLYPNHHTSKIMRIGQVRKDGLFEIIWESKEPIPPVPGNPYLTETQDSACNGNNSDTLTKQT